MPASRSLGLLVLTALIGVAPVLFPSVFYYEIGTGIFIASLVVVGLNILMGYAGQVSLGHAGFFGIGAYAMAIGPARFGLPSMLSILAGLAVTILTAWVVGRPILKLKGHYLAVATLGLGILISMVLSNEAQWTGGPDGMSVPKFELLGFTIRGSRMWYWTSAAVLLIGIWLALNLVDSPTGRALRGLHDSEVAAASNGIDVARYKLVAFTISAGYASLAGSMAALSDGHITPTAAGFLHSVELVTMSVLGGMGSIFGAVIGAGLLKALPQVLTFLHDYEQVVIGAIMMGIMIFLREGILPAVTSRLRSRAP